MNKKIAEKVSEDVERRVYEVCCKLTLLQGTPSGRYMIECKFHNVPIYTGLKEVMYTYARFLDVKDAGFFRLPVDIYKVF